jgi:hypothetical protein
MLECQACHRYVRATESSCPFCATPLALTSAASLTTMPMVAFAAGLSLLACTESEDDAGESNAVTTDPSTSTSESESDTTSGDGDGDTQETLDYGGSDYGGAPPCDEYYDAIPLAVGSNPVDTSMSGDDFGTYCGDQAGTGPDQLMEFVPPAAGQFTFAITGANFDAWLLRSGYYCFGYGEAECVPNQSLQIDLLEGETLHLIIDGAGDVGGTASIDITQG